MSHPIVSIILVNYNGKSFNHSCIDSILKQSYQEFEIIFIDNNSTDASLQAVKSLYHQEIASGVIRIIENSENIGFSGANNQGHALSQGQYIWILNNDTIVHHDTLEKMIAALQTDSLLGAVSCTILDAGFEKEIENMYAQGKVIISNYFGDSVLARVSEHDIKTGIYHTSVLSGCSLLYKKEIIQYPFPEIYFAYGEDVWLSWYMLTQGYTLGVVTGTSINHLGSGSFGKTPSIFKVFHGTKNQRMNFLTFFTRPVTILLLPMFLLVQLAQTFISNPGIRIQGKWKAIIWLIKNRAIIKLQRNTIQKGYKISHKMLLGQLHYLFMDYIYFAKFSYGQMRVIRTINVCFYGIIKIFQIPYRK